MVVPTDALPVATMINMVAGIKLTSANYLPWRRQITHMAECFDLIGLLDGSVTPPSQFSPLPDNATNPNPAFLSWRTKDRKLLSVIYSSLSEEAASEVINAVSSRELWLTLEEVFSSASRHHQLREELLSLRRGDMTVDDYGRRFKGLCDQLSAIGRPVDASDQSHWFLRGLGIQFAHFADTRLAFSPVPVFRDLLNQAKQYDMLIRSMETPPSSVAFYADRSASSSDPSRHRSSHDSGNPQGHSGGRSNHRGRGGRQHSNGGGGGRHSNGGRRPYVPRCQICQGAHYADKCPQFLECRQSMSPANLAKAFSSSCAVSNPPPDWCLDSGASTHMTNQPATLDSLESYSGNSSVIVGNGSNLSISHIGSCRLPNGMRLNDVLVVPHLTKNLVSISKLTSDLPVDVVFSGNLFLIQHRETKEPLARGRCDGGLYYMDRWCPALAAAVRNKVSKASFELWHCRLGHASSSIISLLQKSGSLTVTTDSSSTRICSSCNLAKRITHFISSSRGAVLASLWATVVYTRVLGVLTQLHLVSTQLDMLNSTNCASHSLKPLRQVQFPALISLPFSMTCRHRLCLLRTAQLPSMLQCVQSSFLMKHQILRSIRYSQLLPSRLILCRHLHHSRVLLLLSRLLLFLPSIPRVPLTP
ncbi:Unknown protein [Striga hermonthica]|uniref:GAG-pre-integrase domain-containing protein n=1 Tax=Striga hermonthica TaxID=68872 RepID=A0A9N7P038_STRHE|nr:Unknown protein [Striga hermonthica]